MEATIYANFGELAHEKVIVYDTVAGEIADAVKVEIPSGGYNCCGELLVDIGNSTYTVKELLANVNDTPALRWYDGTGWNTQLLQVV